MNFYFKKNTWLVFSFFVFLNALFFYKIFLGFVPIPSDIVVGAYYPWLDYKWGYTVGVPVYNGLVSDVVSVIYPIKALAVEFIKKGELPLWNPNLFGGYPLLANFQIGLLFPTMIFYLFLPLATAWTLQVFMQPLIALIFMYLYLRELKISKLPSIFGSVVYGFGGFSMVWLEWNTLSLTSAFLPMVLLCADKLLKISGPLWGTLLAIFIVLQIFAGYPQLIAFELIAIYLWALVNFGFKIKGLAKLTFFIIAGILLSSVQLVPALELLNISQRKVEVIDSNLLFLPWQNLIGFIAPDFFGNPSTLNFWGEGNYTLLTIYSSLIGLILASFSVKYFKTNKHIRFLIILFVISLIITLGNPISSFLSNIGIWGGKAASVTRGLFLTNFAVAALSALTLNITAKIKLKEIVKNYVYIFSIILGILVGVFLSRLIVQNSLPNLKPNDFDPELLKDALYLLNNLKVGLRNFILPILIFFSSFMVLFLLKIFKFNQNLAIFLLLFLLIFETFRFGWKFNTFSSSVFLYPDVSITNFLKNNPSRINGGDVIPENMWLPYNLSSYAGYDAVYPIVSANYISVLNSNSPNALPASRYGTIRNVDSPLFDLTGTKYVFALKRNKEGITDAQGQVSFVYQLPHFKKVFEDKSVAVLENTKALPNAFFVSDVKSISKKEVFSALMDKNVSLKESAFVVEKLDSTQFQKSNFNTPEIQRISNSHTRVLTTNQNNGFLVLTDTFYPGWRVYIDGIESKIYQTNAAFRGVKVEGGNRKIDFIYQPKSLVAGLVISLFTALLLLTINLIFFNLKKHEKP